MEEGTREETKPEGPQPKKYTRREFLGFLLGAAGAAVGYEVWRRFGPFGETARAEGEPSYLQPTIIHGVEVYGLGKEKIVNEGQIEQLYLHFDRRFLKGCLERGGGYH